MKEKLLSLAPLEILKSFKDVLLALLANLFSLPKGFPARIFGGRSAVSSGGELEEESSPYARKKRLILLGLMGTVVLLFGILVALLVANIPRPGRADVLNVAPGLSIPVEEFFFPVEPDFLPGFLPEREPRRYWTLDDIRLYWRAPGNSDWWMEGITSTVDSIMEGVP